ncbi:helix-turn-helix transcriptional regulator [Actinomycetospora flava]|uniref:Helix-turn-helix transcriptional regulator n=1 Tax=Actinomycetospora flava TaxID=3129232 RepID=A0ABU8LYZ3_9PSEU
MSDRAAWQELRDERLDQQDARDGYDDARRAHDLGTAVRELRAARGWTQAQLAEAAGMTQSAVARLEAGGTMPTLPVLARLAEAMDADLVVRLAPRAGVA